MYFLDESQIYVFVRRFVRDGFDSKIISVPICGLFVVTILEARYLLTFGAQVSSSFVGESKIFTLAVFLFGSP